MQIKHLLLTASAVTLLAACSADSQSTEPAEADTVTSEATETSTYDNAALEGIPAGTYALDPTHAYLAVSVDHSGGLSDYFITFTDYDATINLDPETLENSTISVMINPKEIFVNYPADYKEGHADSGFDSWSEDITMNENWLNAGEYGEITFESTSVERTGDSTGSVTGDLTFLGVTKPVTLDVVFRGGTENSYGPGHIIGFDATTDFKRSDFGNDTYIPMIGDEIELEFSGEFRSEG